MAGDIAPVLLEKIQSGFAAAFEADGEIKTLYAAIEAGAATYAQANEFAVRTGELLADAFRANLSSAVLPDGKMYYNIAQSVLTPTFRRNYELITGVTASVQEALNAAAGLGLKAQVPAFDQDRLDGIINRVSSEGSFDDVAWILQEPVVNFSQSVVDDSVRVNAEFQAGAGLRPKIVRTLRGKACDWCRALAGVYAYPNVPKDVYRRHENCRCTVEYDPGSGKKQDVWSKKWTTTEESAKIEARKQVGLDGGYDVKKFPVNPSTGERYISHPLALSGAQFGKKIGKHAVDFGLNPAVKKDRDYMREVILSIVEKADERCYGEWRGQEYPVLFHIKGDDVVIESKTGQFITILKGGITNARVKNARKRTV